MVLLRLLRPLAPAALAIVASCALVVGCGGKAIGTDLTSSGDPPGGGDGGATGDSSVCEGTIACLPGDTTIASQADCPPGSACYSVAISCGDNVIWCAPTKGPQCGAVPRCDSGDTEVAACPPPVPGTPDAGSSCYQRTVCGSTITCVHSACDTPPQCNPGDVEVSDPKVCASPDVKCYGVTQCGATIRCYTP